MLKVVINNDNQDEEASQPLLKTKGKGPTSHDWLSGMVSGTEFTCKGSGSNWVVYEYTHGGKRGPDVLLCPTMTLQAPQTWFWVDPVEFSKVFTLRNILEVPNDIEHNSDDGPG